jgi:hypothetical protein
MAPGATLRFLDYEASTDIPNIVVDGSPNRSTVLAISHWPAIPNRFGLAGDLSAEMAFSYLDDPPAHPAAEVVTNNHFDQDGLVGIAALTRPDALGYRELLVDVAAAGDFGTYRFRAAARASMAIAAYADPDRSPIADQLTGLPYDEQVPVLYEETLPLLLPMATEPARFRGLWADEDAVLTASEQAIADGVVVIEEQPDLDLAVVIVPDSLELTGGHRFASEESPGLHPMALHNATDRSRVLVAHGRRYRYVDRYETWVQYRSRRLPSRVDLAPLAAALTALETGAVAWEATPPSTMTPVLVSSDESTLDLDRVRSELARHLAVAPAAWDPYRLDVDEP